MHQATLKPQRRHADAEELRCWNCIPRIVTKLAFYVGYHYICAVVCTHCVVFSTTRHSDTNPCRQCLCSSLSAPMANGSILFCMTDLFLCRIKNGKCSGQVSFQALDVFQSNVESNELAVFYPGVCAAPGLYWKHKAFDSTPTDANTKVM